MRFLAVSLNYKLNVKLPNIMYAERVLLGGKDGKFKIDTRTIGFYKRTIL